MSAVRTVLIFAVCMSALFISTASADVFGCDTLSASDCNWNASCSFDRTSPAGACTTMCYVRQVGNNQSEPCRPGCHKDVDVLGSSSSQCTMNCTSYTDRDSCMRKAEDNKCVWFNNKCTFRCNDISNSAAGRQLCAQSPHCTLFSGGYCYPKCSMYKPNECPDSSCKVVDFIDPAKPGTAPAKKCIQWCGVPYIAGQLCKNATDPLRPAHCTDYGRGCQQSCETFGNADECRLQHSCSWVGGKCRRECQSLQNNTICDTLSHCLVNEATRNSAPSWQSSCLPRCELYNDGTSCTAAGCNWAAGKCHLIGKNVYNNAVCVNLTSTKGLFIPASSSSFCKINCSKVAGEKECIGGYGAIGSCRWNKAASACQNTGICTTFANTSCPMDICDLYTVTGTSPLAGTYCVNKCGDRNNCPSQDNFMNGRYLNFGCEAYPAGCARACGLYLENTTCAADSNCYWDESITPSSTQYKCLPKCSSLPEDRCVQQRASNGRCDWDVLKRKCVPKCSTMNANSNFEGALLKDNTTCLSRPECQWDTTYTTPRCTDNCMKIQDRNNCGGSNCWWDNDRAKCVPRDCSILQIGRFVNGAKIADNSTCIADPRCEFRGSWCYTSCAKIPFEFCPAGTCRRAGGKCLERCTYFRKNQYTSDNVRITDNSTCLATPGCYSDVSGSTCRETCEQHDEKSCGRWPVPTSCEWRHKKCQQKCTDLSKGDSYHGKTINDNTTCLAHPHCMWIAGSNACRYSCKDHESESSCTSATNCRWEKASKKCLPTCGTLSVGFTNLDTGAVISSNTTCISTPGCYSDFNYDKACLTNCHAIKERAECTAPGSGCAWDSNAKYCYHTCYAVSTKTLANGVKGTINVPYCLAKFTSKFSTGMSSTFRCGQLPMNVCPGDCLQPQKISPAPNEKATDAPLDYSSGCLPECTRFLQKSYNFTTNVATENDCKKMNPACTNSSDKSNVANCKYDCRVLNRGDCLRVSRDSGDCFLGSDGKCDFYKQCTNNNNCSGTDCHVNKATGRCEYDCAKFKDAWTCAGHQAIQNHCGWNSGLRKCEASCSASGWNVTDCKLRGTRCAARASISSYRFTNAPSMYCEKSCGGFTQKDSCRAGFCWWVNDKCTDRCESHWSGQCELSGFCTKNPVTGACTVKCDAIQIEADCNLQATCNFNTSSKKCYEMCSAQESKGGCPHGCIPYPQTWSGANCGVDCSHIADVDTCHSRSNRDSQKCKWVNHKCVPSCGEFDPKSCAAGPHCNVIPVGAHGTIQQDTCTYNCSLLSGVECLRFGSPHCQLDSNLKCVRNCQYLYKQSECAANPMCTDALFQSFGNECIPKCEALTAANCYNQHCALFGGKCMPRCDVDARSCPSFSNCIVATETSTLGQKKCKVDCGKLSTKSECGSVSHCNWDGKQCEFQCQYLAEADCATFNSKCAFDKKAEKCALKCDLFDECNCPTAGCMVATVSNLPTCTSKCSTRLFDTCESDGNCAWSTGGGSCKPKCSAFTTDKCPTEGCTVVNGKCAPKCSSLTIHYTSPLSVTDGSCAAEAHCEKHGDDRLCVTKCESLTRKKDCEGQQDCLFVLGQCIRKCSSYTTVSLRTALLNNCPTGCQAGKPSLCMPSCNSTFMNDNYVACRSQGYSQCQWRDEAPAGQPLCVFAYCNQLNKNDCVTGAGCAWDMLSGSCVYDCAMDTAATCNKDAGCGVYNGKCMRNCNNRNQDECKSMNTTCDWVGGAGCRTKCAALTDMTECSTRWDCHWHTNMTCLPACNLLNQNKEACALNTDCKWEAKPFSGGVCRTDCSLLGKTQCINDRKCSWELLGAEGTGTCVDACSQFTQSIHNNGGKCPSNCIPYTRTNLQQRDDPYALNNEVSRDHCTNNCEGRNMTVCMDTRRCVWNNASGMCGSDCRFFRSHNCPITAGCMVNGMKKCTFQCSAYNNITCPSSSCDVDINNNCVAKCHTLTATECAAASNCASLWTGQTCIPKCPSYAASVCPLYHCQTAPSGTDKAMQCISKCEAAKAQADCLSSATPASCSWQAGRCMATCSKFTLVAGDTPSATVSGYTKQEWCGQMPNCMWNGRTSACDTLCEAYTSDACPTGCVPQGKWCTADCSTRSNSDCLKDVLPTKCELNSTKSQGCRANCTVFSAAHCPSTHCSVENGMCIHLCHEYPVDSCPFGSCIVHNGQCLKSCKAIPADATCELAGYCGSRCTPFKSCTTKCSSFNAGECPAWPAQQRQCSIHNKTCMDRCDAARNSVECGMMPNCTFNFANDRCEYPCEKGTVDDCNTHDNCVLNNGICEYRCGQYSAPNCGPMCQQRSVTACTPKCSQRTTIDECHNRLVQNSYCTWNATSSSCREMCYAYSADNCPAHCEVRGQGCAEKCNSYLEKDCPVNGCAIVGGKCQRPCPTGNDVTAAECTAVDNCLFNAAMAVKCYLNCSAITGSRDKCEYRNQGICAWNTTHCVRACDQFSQAECPNQMHCAYNEFVGCIAKANVTRADQYNMVFTLNGDFTVAFAKDRAGLETAAKNDAAAMFNVDVSRVTIVDMKLGSLIVNVTVTAIPAEIYAGTQDVTEEKMPATAALANKYGIESFSVAVTSPKYVPSGVASIATTFVFAVVGLLALLF